jgi:hypothetical protein
MRKYRSLFSQLLQFFPRIEFENMVKKRLAEFGSKGFTCRQQFVSMFFSQLGSAHSLSEITNGLATCEGKLRHLGIKAPKKSTLAYANTHRPWELYHDVFFSMLEKTRVIASSVKRKDGYLPDYAIITDGKRHDAKVAHFFNYNPGSITVFDRAYVDYNLLYRIHCNDAFFVTRLKSNADYEVVEERTVPWNNTVLSDKIIRLSGYYTSKKYPELLRIVTYYDEDGDRTLIFLTNNMKLAAITIAMIYKERGEIELFFKSLNQNLKIKSFVGTSSHAVKIQIWTALIAMRLLKYLKLNSCFGWSLSNLAALLRMNLFTYRDLWSWIDKPFETVPVQEESIQMKLIF